MLPMRLPRLAMVAVDAASRPVMRRGDGVSVQLVQLCAADQHTVASEAAEIRQVALADSADGTNKSAARAYSPQRRAATGRG